MAERRLRVVWSDAATLDLLRIASWIAAESPTDAAIVLTRLRKRAATLAAVPARGRVVPELTFFGISVLREVVERPYRVVYRISERTIYVVGVFDGRRELEDVLLERLTASPAD